MSSTSKVPPDKLTMNDIARLAGVDKSTVSRALSSNPLVAQATREHVQRVAMEHGYIVDAMARSLRSRRTNTIAVVIPLRHDSGQQISDPFFMEMVAHLADALADRGYDLLLSKMAADTPRWLEALDRSRRADGLVLVGQSFEHEQIARAAEAGTKLVVWGADLPDHAYVTVGTDNEAGGDMAARHLIERGRTRIAFLGDTRLPEIEARHHGYVKALRRAGITPDENLLVPALFEPELAFGAMQALLAGGHPFDAVLGASDVIALAAMRALHGHGLRVPQDVSVAGFDDIALARHASPPLTTVRQDIARGADALGERIVALIQGQPAESVTMTPTLIVRASA